MTHTYQITGMTCASCEAKVRSSLLLVPDLTEAEGAQLQVDVIVRRLELRQRRVGHQRLVAPPHAPGGARRPEDGAVARAVAQEDLILLAHHRRRRGGGRG